jgi:hypothetical protein
LKLLFVHQNFPGQFLHLAPEMQRRGHDVRALVDATNKNTADVPLLRYTHAALEVDAKATVAGVAAGATVPEVRQAFAKYAEVDHITEFSPQDLDISKEGNQIVISFDYEKKIPLGFNVSLLINYRGTTSGSSAD